ncbi:unnamed protein product [Mortierella alpina]
MSSGAHCRDRQQDCVPLGEQDYNPIDRPRTMTEDRPLPFFQPGDDPLDWLEAFKTESRLSGWNSKVAVFLAMVCMHETARAHFMPVVRERMSFKIFEEAFYQYYLPEITYRLLRDRESNEKCPFFQPGDDPLSWLDAFKTESALSGWSDKFAAVLALMSMHETARALFMPIVSKRMSFLAFEEAFRKHYQLVLMQDALQAAERYRQADHESIETCITQMSNLFDYAGIQDESLKCSLFIEAVNDIVRDEILLREPLPLQETFDLAREVERMYRAENRCQRSTRKHRVKHATEDHVTKDFAVLCPEDPVCLCPPEPVADFALAVSEDDFNEIVDLYADTDDGTPDFVDLRDELPQEHVFEPQESLREAVCETTDLPAKDPGFKFLALDFSKCAHGSSIFAELRPVPVQIKPKRPRFLVPSVARTVKEIKGPPAAQDARRRHANEARVERRGRRFSFPRGMSTPHAVQVTVTVFYLRHVAYLPPSLTSCHYHLTSTYSPTFRSSLAHPTPMPSRPFVSRRFLSALSSACRAGAILATSISQQPLPPF